MIIFLYGQDSYKISQKLNELIRGYKAKNPSGLNLINLDLAENRLEDFFESIKSGSLIPEKKLIILKNILRADSETLLKFLKSQNLSKRDSIILIIIHFGNPLKSKLFEYLIKKPNQAQNFKLLKAYEIKSWAKQFSNSLGIDLTGEALDFQIKGVVSKSQVEELAVPSANYNVFRLTDALAKKNKKKTLEALYAALDNGEKPTELLGLLAWQIRNLLRFKSNPDRSSDLKLHPFVLEKIRESAGFFSIDELSAILFKIINLDLAFKTGGFNEKTALSLLISEL